MTAKEEGEPHILRQPRGGLLLTMLETIVDQLPESRRLAPGEYGTHTRKAIERLLPHVSAEEREAIVRSAVRHRLGERVIFHFHSILPSVAGLVARLVPLRSSRNIKSLFESNAPVVIGSAHFGPLFFELLVLRRLTRERHVVVVLRQGAFYLRQVIPLLQRFGFEIAFDSPDSVRVLLRTLKARPRTVVMFMFDHTHDGRRIVPFLAAHITACNGTGLIADAGEARVVTAIWRWDGLIPHVDLGGPYLIDRSLPLTVRRQKLLDELNELLQNLVRAIPEQ